MIKSSPGEVEAVRRSVSLISSVGRTFKSGIVRRAGPASAGGRSLRAFLRSVRRKTSPFLFGLEVVPPARSLSRGSPNWSYGLAHLANAYASYAKAALLIR